MRRAAAERGAVEMKKNEFQGELKKQREQIDKIQSMHDFQIENINKIHRDEKVEVFFLFIFGTLYKCSISIVCSCIKERALLIKINMQFLGVTLEEIVKIVWEFRIRT